MTNPFRQSAVASPLANGEAQVTLWSREVMGSEESETRGMPWLETRTRYQGRQGVVGDGMVGRSDDVKQGDLSGSAGRSYAGFPIGNRPV